MTVIIEINVDFNRVLNVHPPIDKLSYNNIDQLQLTKEKPSPVINILKN
jgi:hypothetical protein